MEHFSINFYIFAFLFLQHFITIKSNDDIQKEVEKEYIQFILSPSLTKGYTNSVCSLSKNDKIALCQRIFLQRYLIEAGIKLNKVAFFINTVKCEKKPVGFKKNIFFSDEIVMQEMYTCYGRHEPIRTNYRIDHFYDEFHIASGFTENSVIIFKREYNIEYVGSVQYYVYKFENITLPQVQRAFLKISTVLKEFNFDKEDMLFHTNLEEIENIFVRENENDRKDKVCILKLEQKMSLCKIVLQQDIFNRLGLFLNAPAYYFINPECINVKILFRHIKHYKNKIFRKKVLPCFYRQRGEVGNPLESDYLFFIFVSEGPRDDSLLLYTHYEHVSNKTNPIKHELNLFEFVEQFNFMNFVLPSLNLTLKMKELNRKLDENDANYEHLRKFNTLLELHTQYSYTKLKTIQKILEKKINLRKNSQSKKDLELKSGATSNLNRIFLNLQKEITVVYTKEVFKESSELQTTWKYLRISSELLVKKILKLDDEIHRILVLNEEISEDISIKKMIRDIRSRFKNIYSVLNLAD